MTKKAFEVVEHAVKVAMRVTERADVTTPTTAQVYEGTLRRGGYTRKEYDAEMAKRTPRK